MEASEVYVLQLHEADGRTSTEGVTLSQTVAENWVAEPPFDISSVPYGQGEWRSYETHTPIEDLT